MSKDTGWMAPQRLGRLADLCNEAGMLRHTPRSGYAFLGSGKENVAEHSWRVSVIGHMLARMAGADAGRVVLLCLFHDLHEARTGDFNYVNHRYNTSRARDALVDAVSGSGLEEEILGGWDELDAGQSPEAALAADADQIDLICNLNLELHRGNDFAREWLDTALKRLRTAQGQALAEAVLRTNPHRWWYEQVDKDWWIHHRDPE